MIDPIEAIVYLGALTVFIWLCKILQLFYRTFCGTSCTTKRYGAKSWAVVTGATDGIGLAAARELAKRGFNIAILASRKDKLATVEK